MDIEDLLTEMILGIASKAVKQLANNHPEELINFAKKAKTVGEFQERGRDMLLAASTFVIDYTEACGINDLDAQSASKTMDEFLVEYMRKRS